jgi:hypothetical protein
MDIIKNNPFRVLGILVGTSTKDEHSKIKKLKMLVEAGQEVPVDFSFPIIGDLNREIKNVEDVISKLNLNKDRVTASLFWFYNGNPETDMPVFEAMKSSIEEYKETVKIWTSLAANQEITKENASAFQNVSTIRLINVFGLYGKHNFKKLESAILLKLKFLESDFVNDFVSLSTDETFEFSKESLQIMFLDQVYLEIQKYAKTEILWYMNFLNSISFVAKEKYLTEFIKEPTEKLKEQIEKSKINRKTNEEKAYDYGQGLYGLAEKFLPIFENILGKNDLQYSSIADKFSDEILQCGIVYFKRFRDTNTDPSEKTKDLFLKAKKIAVGSIAIQRCQDNTESLEEWINNPENKVRAEVNQLILFFDEMKNNYHIFSNTSNNITTFTDAFKFKIENSFSILIKINLKTGKESSLYIELCSTLSMLITNTMVNLINITLGNKYLLLYDTWDIIAKIKLLPKSTEASRYIRTIENSLSSIDPMLSAAKLLNSPKILARKELEENENLLERVHKKVFLKSEMDLANSKLIKLKAWQPFRNKEEKESQIAEQQNIIDNLLIKSEVEKKAEIERLNKVIYDIQKKIKYLNEEINLYR